MLQVEGIHAFGAEVHLTASQTVCNITISTNLPIPKTAILAFIAGCCRLTGDTVISTGRTGSLILEISIHACVANLTILGTGQAVRVRVLTSYACQSAQVETVEADALSLHWC